MKQVLLIIVWFVSLNSFAQNEKVKFDYTVSYAIPNKNTGVKDTITVSLNKSGTFLYTKDLKSFAETFKNSVFKNSDYSPQEISSDILFNTDQAAIYINMEFGENLMFLKMKLADLVPQKFDDNFNEDVATIYEKMPEKTMVLGAEYDMYKLYADIEKENFLKLVIDSSRPVDNNNILKQFFILMLNKSKSKAKVSLDLPAGLIVGIINKDDSVIEAVNLKDTSFQIDISHNFKITK